jgi:tRNA threonylcarbamoyladenosine biosynthesis protein TsaB
LGDVTNSTDAKLVLGIDTATWTASVGVVCGGRDRAEISRQVSASHASVLLELIEETLDRAGLEIGEIDLLAVSIGPGSFTGLRIGLSTAKGLAMATGAAVVGVPTLEALALAAGQRSGVVCPVLDARKGEVYAGTFRSHAGTVLRVADDAVVDPRRLARTLERPCTLVGDAVEPYRAVWEEELGDAVELVPFDEIAPRGSLVARLGARRFEDQGGADLTRLEPQYCRKSEAELKRN